MTAWQFYPEHLPPRAMGLVAEWATINQKELQALWKKALNHQRLERLEPLS